MTNTKQTRKKLIYSTAAFIASTAIGSIPASAWTEQEKRDAYINSGEFTNCDLRRMLFGEYDTFDRVKIRIGKQILQGFTKGAKSNSQDARELHRANGAAQCTFEDGDYSYEDAEDLAKFWGMSNVEDAKKRIVELLDTGFNKQIRKDLKQAWK